MKQTIVIPLSHTDIYDPTYSYEYERILYSIIPFPLMFEYEDLDVAERQR